MVIQQLGLALGIPLVIVFLLLLALDWPPDVESLLRSIKVVGGVGAFIFFVLLPIALLVTFAGGYEMEYRLNERGIGGRTVGRTAKRNAIVNFLLILSGRPTAMGAGMAAQARQVEYVAWKDVQRVEADPKRRLITLKKGRWPLMVVACDEAHYDAVLQEAQAAVIRNEKPSHRSSSRASR
ncbi:MAG: hypothetical protein D6724_05640 [Armatimonadetes bacterium]|nr:MAG: hypothetical protein D6724_05640 [Armatimonadota bacterium]